jgi:hypothetical protein
MLNTKDQFAYIAGFFDAEGCVYIQICSSGRTQLRLNLGQKNLRTLESIRRLTGGRLRGPRQGSWRLWFTGIQNPARVIELLYPYVIYKRPQLDVALQYLELEPKDRHGRLGKKLAR